MELPEVAEPSAPADLRPGREPSAALGLPTFTAHGQTFYRRLTLTGSGRIEEIFIPVLAPGRNAEEVSSWLESGDGR